MRFLALHILFLLALCAPAALAGSLEDWMSLEKNRLDRTVNEERILAPDTGKLRKEYLPESKKPFEVKSIWLPEQELQVAIDQAALPHELEHLFVREVNGKKEYRLLIHPESEEFYKSFLKTYPLATDEKFLASTTASGRTLLFESTGGKKFFAKISLDVEMGGARRTVPATEVARSVGTSQYLRDLSDRAPNPRFTNMPEPLGITPRGWERGGMILRVIPEEIMSNEKKYMPIFSLYKRPKKGKTELEKLAGKMSISPEQFVEDHLLRPFYEGWVKWKLEGGVSMEAHAQNFLMELDAKGLPTGRFQHRDLGGFFINTKAKSFQPKQPLLNFNGLDKDYFRGKEADALADSLYTYFDGGVMFNIDRELKRIQPGYKEGSIFEKSRALLAEELKRQSGAWINAGNLGSRMGLNSEVDNAVEEFEKISRSPRAPGMEFHGSCSARFAGTYR